MTVSAAEFLKGSYNAQRLLGDKAIASDAIMVIDGFEQLQLLTKQFPWPELSTVGEIEVPGPLGSASWQPGQLKTAQQGAISFMETVGGQVHNFCDAVNARGGRFQATVYEGTPERFYRGCKLVDCFVQLDNPDRDMESRQQILLVTGTLFFHYFGDKIPGNIPL
jgi:hypothetical protein